jgi:indolepyruvate decarboxylase
MATDYTVAQYLKSRLEQLGQKRIFGVAGNYTAPLLNTILADPDSPIAISGNANELCAGYAADGHARLTGISAVSATYGVGAFSFLNTVAGSYTELAPVILINGAPTNKEDSVEKNAGLLYSHTTGNVVPDIVAFERVTVAAERITNARQAPYQIDSALTALLTEHRPVYLEVTEDVWRAPCILPVGKLTSGANAIVTSSETAPAIAATMQMVRSLPKVVFWAGVELHRFGLEDQFLGLLDAVNRHAQPGQEVHFVTSALSKSVVSESHPLFEGCLTMTRQEIQTLVGADGCLIGLGAWTTGKDTANQNIRNSNLVLAAHNGVWAGAQFFPLIGLSDYMAKLEAALVFPGDASLPLLQGLRLPPALRLSAAPPAGTSPDQDQPLTYDSFFATLNDWLTEDDTLVVDAGFPLVGAQSVRITAEHGFVAQAAWLAIGYSVAAATGVKVAQPDRRVIVVVGDGAFHETCQAVADHHAHGQNNVVFVLANGLYGIEQQIVNPNVFRAPPIDYPDQQLDRIYPYNRLPAWRYDKVTEAFGGEGRKALTAAELTAVMEEIRSNPDRNFVVEVPIPTTDVPANIRVGLAAAVGEDEFQNPAWPPAQLF